MTDDFYVGYLPLPRGHRRFLLVLIPLLLAAVLAVSAALTSQQPEPGSGTWDLSQTVTLTGVLKTEPYTAITLAGDGETPAREVLLVTMGKIGGEGLGLVDAGGPVAVTGYPIARGDTGTLLLAVEFPSQDIVPGTTPPPPEPRTESLGPATLVGQIIDPKCYFGAMKPGEGKVHKACASLCIRGGIPPMFMTTDAAGDRTYYLLLDEAGRGIAGDQLEALLPFVADPVRITGEVERRGGLLLLRTDPATIQWL